MFIFSSYSHTVVRRLIPRDGIAVIVDGLEHGLQNRGRGSVDRGVAAGHGGVVGRALRVHAGEEPRSLARRSHWEAVVLDDVGVRFVDLRASAEAMGGGGEAAASVVVRDFVVRDRRSLLLLLTLLTSAASHTNPNKRPTAQGESSNR